MPERRMESHQQLREILDKISFAPSCVNLDWQWDIEEVHEAMLVREGDDFLSQPLKGWLVNTSFVRPDTTTGEVSRGKGRQEFIAIGTSESGVVKTCWLLAELIVRHELMEAFHYNGMRIFDPHHSVEELSAPQLMKKQDIFVVNQKVWKRQ